MVLVGILVLLSSGIQAQGTAAKESPAESTDGAVLAEMETLAGKLSPLLQRAISNRIQQLKGDIYVETKIVQALEDDLEIDAELPVLPETDIAAAWVNADIHQRFLKARLEMQDCLGEEFRPTHPYSLFSRYEIPYNEGGLLSIVTENYQYTGGAHGMTYKTAYNVDLNQGRLLPLRDFFPKRDNYQSFIKTKIKESLKTSPESNALPDAPETIDSYQGDFSFYIKGKNIVVFFHPMKSPVMRRAFGNLKYPMMYFHMGQILFKLNSKNWGRPLSRSPLFA